MEDLTPAAASSLALAAHTVPALMARPLQNAASAHLPAYATSCGDVAWSLHVEVRTMMIVVHNPLLPMLLTCGLQYMALQARCRSSVVRRRCACFVRKTNGKLLGAGFSGTLFLAPDIFQFSSEPGRGVGELRGRSVLTI